MNDKNEQVYALAVIVDAGCFTNGHQVEALDDALICADCADVVCRALVDGVDPRAALELFRSGDWS